jgi:hypothetical protein
MGDDEPTLEYYKPTKQHCYYQRSLHNENTNREMTFLIPHFPIKRAISLRLRNF